MAAITGHFNVRLVYGAGPTTVDLDPANFVTTIDNPYFPLTPGTTFI